MGNRALSITDSIKKIQLSGKLNISGRVTKYDGHFLECDGFPANLGSICTVAASDGTETMAEIIGFKKGNNILSMFESDTKIQSGAKVSIVDDGHDVKVGEGRSMKSFNDCKMLPSLSHKPTAIKPGSRSFHG